MQFSIDRIVKAGLCHGCGGCAGVLTRDVISMELNSGGYFRPAIRGPLTPQQSATVCSICSGYEVTHEPMTYRSDTVLGPVMSIHTGHALDSELRHRGSSGGVISALALYLLEQKEVEFVLQTVAPASDPFGNTMQQSRSRADILAAAGSRYAPSSPLAELETHLNTGKRFAFVGRPCDVCTLRRIARYDRRIADQVPVMLSFMCAGTPSRAAVLDVIKAMGAQSTDVIRFAFRGEGWPGYTRALLLDGRELRMSYSAAWGEILGRKLQFRCKICADGVGEFADIVCADAWFSEIGYPNFAERPGRSLVICRTTTGQRMLEKAVSARYISSKECSSDDIRLMQPYQYARKRGLAARLMAIVAMGGRIPKYRRLGLLRAMGGSNPVFQVRSFLGMVARVWRARDVESM